MDRGEAAEACLVVRDELEQQCRMLDALAREGIPGSDWNVFVRSIASQLSDVIAELTELARQTKGEYGES